MKSYKKMCLSNLDTTEELYNAIKEMGGNGKVTIIRKDGEHDIRTIYTFFQDKKQISPDIIIPKTEVFTKAEIIDIDGVKYLRLYINDTEYIEAPLTDLSKIYEADEISLTLEGNKFRIHDGYLSEIATSGSYNDLTDIPSIDGKAITGAKTSTDYGIESISNRSTEISGKSSDNEYPTAKSVYDFVMKVFGNLELIDDKEY